MNTLIQLANVNHASQLPVDQNPAAVYLASLAKGSRRTMADALVTIAALATGTSKTELIADERKRLVSIFPWHGLRYEHTQAIRAGLLELYAPATANRMLAALRGVLRQAWQLGYTDADTFQRAASVKIIKGKTTPAGRVISGGELVRLFGACQNDTSPAGIRDTAILATMYGLGLRRAEIAGLTLVDYDRAGQEIKVRGKGRKERLQPVTGNVAKALGAWLEIRGDEPGAMFVPINKSGRLDIRAMTDQGIYSVLSKRTKQAGLSNVSPHDLRRSFVTHMLDNGADVLSVQKLAGHESTQTTLRYDRRDEKAKRRAVELLNVPC